jgi:hypothetical protein
MRSDIRSAIYSSVFCIPSELCELIAQYVVRKAHSWNAAGFDVQVRATAIKSEVAIAEILDQPFRWYSYIFVSEVSLAHGDQEWSVDWGTNAGHDDTAHCTDCRVHDEWIGVGLTRSERNRRDINIDPPWRVPTNDWILVNVGNEKDRLLQLRGCPGRELALYKTYWPVTKIFFSANPIDKTIRFRCQSTLPSTNGSFTIQDSREHVFPIEVPDFESLRPCVVLRGSVKAVIKSGESFPA